VERAPTGVLKATTIGEKINRKEKKEKMSFKKKDNRERKINIFFP
jgi:hypothetical protein